MSALPPLREDLILDPKPSFIEGQLSYLLIDPIKNAYFRISQKMLAILKTWDLGDPELILETLEKDRTQAISKNDLDQTLRFLVENELVVSLSPEFCQHLNDKIHRKKAHWFTTLLKQYLFFKIPLLKPDRFLNATYPLAKPLMHRAYWWFILCLCLLGIYLTIPEFYQFFSPLHSINTLEGIVYLITAMIISKIVHELGHAYTSKYFGCKVTSFGVAFIVLFPILYTDTTDAWRIKNPRWRLMIDCAGVLAEIQLMAWCLFAWHVVDSAVTKDIITYIITVGLVSTLLINGNPLLRFDGYYALSNILKIENLQAQSFALARWKLRSVLIGLKTVPPVILSRKSHRLTLLYAYLTWIYRFFLYLAIAVLVYHLFFKLLGIFLMAVELYYFIIQPILNEVFTYFKHIRMLKVNKHIIVFFIAIFTCIFLLLFPWSTTITMPAVLSYQYKQDNHVPEAALALSMPVTNGQTVERTGSLARFSSPEIGYQIQLVKNKIVQLKLNIHRQQSTFQQASYKHSDAHEYKALKQELQSLINQQKRLQLLSPFDGVVYNRSPDIDSDRWYDKDDYLFTVAKANHWVVKAYLAEHQLNRIEYIKSPVFISNNPWMPVIKLSLLGISNAATKELQTPYLASTHGGPLAVYDESKNSALKLQGSYFKLLFTASHMPSTLNIEQRGLISIRVSRQSFIKRIYQKVMGIILRESNF